MLVSVGVLLYLSNKSIRWNLVFCRPLNQHLWCNWSLIIDIVWNKLILALKKNIHDPYRNTYINAELKYRAMELNINLKETYGVKWLMYLGSSNEWLLGLKQKMIARGGGSRSWITEVGGHYMSKHCTASCRTLRYFDHIEGEHNCFDRDVHLSDLVRNEIRKGDQK